MFPNATRTKSTAKHAHTLSLTGCEGRGSGAVAVDEIGIRKKKEKKAEVLAPDRTKCNQNS